MFDYRRHRFKPKATKLFPGSKVNNVFYTDYERWEQKRQEKITEMLEWWENVRSIGRVNEFDIRLDDDIDKAVDDAVYAAVDTLFSKLK